MHFDLMNADGWAKTTERVRQLTKVPTISHIVMGSFTVLPREGNTGGTNFQVAPEGTSVNSLGLPNGGLPYLEQHGEDMVQSVYAAEKIPVISIAGFSPKEYGVMAVKVHALKAIAELNIGCPNVHDGGHQKEIISYDFALLKRTLECVFEATSGPVWVKPSPYANPADRERFVNLVKHFDGAIDGIVGCNTFPNVSMYHANARPYLDVANNYAGMAGTALKWINLSQCRFYAESLPDYEIIGAGGIRTPQDVLDYTFVGCSGGQIGTAFFENENFRVFEEVASAFA